MANMENFNPEQMSLKTMDEAIRIANIQVTKFKDNKEKQNKYKNAVANLTDSKEKLTKCIEATKKIDESGNPLVSGATSFYDSFVKGKENAVSLCWLNGKLGSAQTVLNSVDSSVPTDEMESFSTHYDIFDATKHAGKDLLSGGKLSKGVVATFLGVGIAELLSRGVTGFLAGRNIMEEQLGLFGLGKLGFSKLPELGGLISEGASMLWGFSKIFSVAAIGFVALKTIPMVTRAIKNYKAKHDKAHEFDLKINKAISEQLDPDAPTR